jgi:hypothetical protein
MKHNTIRPAFLGLVVVLALGAMSGCRPTPKPADPEKGREALRAALAAWQNGESADVLRGRSPSITAADRQWQEGYRLTRYEIADGGEVVGYDLQCRVVLWLQGPGGKQTKEKAVYSVSTHPSLVVVRAEG